MKSKFDFVVLTVLYLANVNSTYMYSSIDIILHSLLTVSHKVIIFPGWTFQFIINTKNEKRISIMKICIEFANCRRNLTINIKTWHYSNATSNWTVQSIAWCVETSLYLPFSSFPNSTLWFCFKRGF